MKRWHKIVLGLFLLYEAIVLYERFLIGVAYIRHDVLWLVK